MQGFLSAASSAQAADVGEIMVVSNQVKADWRALHLNTPGAQPTVNETTVYGPWMRRWRAQAWALIRLARNSSSGWDHQARSSALLRAHSYLFLAQWPYPTTDTAFNTSRLAREVFVEAMSFAGWQTVYLNASFIYAPGITIEQPVVVALPYPAGSSNNHTLPLLLVSTGLDYFKVWPPLVSNISK